MATVRLSPLSIGSTVFLSMSIMTLAMAQTADMPINCSSRLPSLERAQCLVKQHFQIMQWQQRTSVPSDTTMVPAPASSAVSSAENVISCSRAYGVARAQCLFQQHKQILQMLSAHPAVSTTPAVTGPGRPVCFRYSNRIQRLQCMNGKPVTPISSSSSSSSSTASSTSSQ